MEGTASVFWEGSFNLRFCLDLTFNDCEHAFAVAKRPGQGVLHGAAAIGDTGRCAGRAPAVEVERDRRS